jgi:hypothetical protein
MAAKGPDIKYVRGDTAPFTLLLTRDGTALDLTGFTAIEIVVNADDQPGNAANEQFRQPGTIVAPATDGRISFQPAGIDTAARETEADAYVPGDYFYDLQVRDATGERSTLLNGGNYQVQQDINKAG